MVDREKVIEGLERCKPAWFTVCNCTCSGECPYNKFGHNEGGCVDHLIDDALALLHELEPVKPEVYMVANEYTFYRCPACKIGWHYKYDYCPKCGRAVKWE